MWATEWRQAMTSKIFRSTLLVAAVILLCSLGVVMGVLYNHFSAVRTAQLKDELSLAVTGTEQYGNAFLENVEADRFRITWIDTDGTVLFDTQIDQTTMENHGDREEIREALQSGSGSSVRTSSTLTAQTFYEAQRLQDGTVLRISISQRSVWSLMIGLLQPVLLVAILAIGLSALLSRRMAKRIVEPLNALDLEHPLKNDSYAEISPLLQRINRQHNQIAAYIETLRQKNDEWEQITANMQEGLIVLNSEGTVLRINPTAKRLFEAADTCVGKSFLMLTTDSSARNALNDALDQGRGSFRLHRDGRDYELDLSRIASNGTVIGAVVLAFDITERLNAEQLRQEFSANVSHELKTPLQSIIGSAELMENGLVKAEDTPRFVGHIRKEAVRLVSLIEDILRLSRLDENAPMPTEPVDLLALAEEVKKTLAPSAAAKAVSIEITGSGFTVTGVRQLLYELLYNLCDNAVKYNMQGGSVHICAEGSTLTVTDTGIGIPREHISRVFERFYRVDKSHSKASGGTGLGLSIVKHAAAYHHAALDLQSTPNHGTTVTVTF